NVRPARASSDVVALDNAGPTVRFGRDGDKPFDGYFKSGENRKEQGYPPELVGKLANERMTIVDEQAAKTPRDAASDGPHVVRLTMPAKAEYITLSRLALTGLTRLRPLSDELLADLKLALTEATSNSVRHAYPDGGGHVDIL